MERRTFLSGLGSGMAVLACSLSAHAAARDKRIVELHDSWMDFLPAGHRTVSIEPRLKRSTKQWREQLPENAFEVLFEEDTERPFSSPLNEEKRTGVYCCRACGLPLFTSAMKYDSGTGWPSFFTAIPGHLGTKSDYKLIWPRTEYHCIKCGGHQGHVFDDGPLPTRERWCNNGLALRFVPKAG